MNKEQFQELKATVPNFVQNHCFKIDAKLLVFDAYTSQIRKSGHVKSAVPRMGETLANPTNTVPPVTVQWRPARPDEQPVVLASRPNMQGMVPEIKEGCTRGLGGQTKGLHIWASDYHDQVLKYNDDQWKVLQAQGNDHPIANPNTGEDMEMWISNWIKSGAATRHLGFPYTGHESDYIEQAALYCQKTVYKNSGKNIRWFKNRVIQGLAGKVAASYEQYTTELAFKKFENLNTHGWQGHQSGMEFNGHTVFVLDSNTRFNPNVMGGVMVKRVDSKNVKYNIVAWVGSLAGKSDADIFEERSRIVKSYDKYNTEYSCFDALYFLPQIKSGKNAENMNTLIKVR